MLCSFFTSNELIFFVFRQRTNKRKRKVIFLKVSFPPIRQGLPKAMHLALDGKGVFVYTLRPKDKFSVRLRHFCYNFLAHFAHDFAVFDAGEVVRKDCLPVVYSARTKNVLVHDV